MFFCQESYHIINISSGFDINMLIIFQRKMSEMNGFFIVLLIQ